MKRFLLFPCLLIAVFISQSAFTQSSLSDSTFELKRSINLNDKDTETKNITIEVSEKTLAMGLNISCKVLLGNLKIEIYDPKGKKQGEFSVESQYSNKLPLSENDAYNKEVVEGQIEKRISQPIPGQWIIKLIPEKVYASVQIKSRFSQN